MEKEAVVMKRVIATLGVLVCVAFLVRMRVEASPHAEPPEADDQFGPWSPPVNLGPIVNSGAVEGGPGISRDGLSLYFHSTRGAAPPIPDVYVSRRAAIDLPWEPPVALGSILNSDIAHAGPTLSKNGHLMFFGSFRSGSWDILMTRRNTTHDDFAWEAGVPLPSPINGSSFDVPSDYFENPTGGAELYFASDRGNGLGAAGLHIYVAHMRHDGTWSDPQYVAELNSAFADDRPTVRADGLEVIFNSSRAGNLDLYVSRREHVWEPWSAPENLGPTVNSTAGDIHPALSANGRTLYFASSRSGNFDLYASTRSKTRGD
jgi:Tol biopolymer transport system component